MRGINFRGKRLDNGEWVYGNLVCKHVESPVPETTMEYMATYITSQEFDAWEVEVDPGTVGQFTGIRCKDGHLKPKDLYEGDIITAGHAMLEITYNTEEVGFVARTNEGPYLCGLDITINDIYHIVGNVHDNPELMEE